MAPAPHVDGDPYRESARSRRRGPLPGNRPAPGLRRAVVSGQRQVGHHPVAGLWGAIFGIPFVAIVNLLLRCIIDTRAVSEVEGIELEEAVAIAADRAEAILDADAAARELEDAEPRSAEASVTRRARSDPRPHDGAASSLPSWRQRPMPRLQAKSFAAPDDIRTMPKVRFETVGLDEATVGHCRFEPGWRWSTDIGPMVGSPSCPIRHLGYSMSGTVRVVMDDGQALDIGPDTVFDVPPGHDKWVIGDEPWVTIEWGASGRALGAALHEAGTRSLATVLFTDIVDSTARLQVLGDAAWRDLLAAHNARLREQLNIFRGREVKTTGDGFLAIFDAPTRAVRCAAEMVRSTRAIAIEIRVGIHTGEIELVGDDVRGIAVHTAARMVALAGPGEVLVSSTTSGLLEGSDLVLEDAGAHELKGLTGARQVFRHVVSQAG